MSLSSSMVASCSGRPSSAVRARLPSSARAPAVLRTRPPVAGRTCVAVRAAAAESPAEITTDTNALGVPFSETELLALDHLASLAEGEDLEAFALNTVEQTIGNYKGKRVDPLTVAGALLTLESAFIGEARGGASLEYCTTGRWFLMFSTATKIKSFQYIPVDEYIIYNETDSGIDLQLLSYLGPKLGGVKALIENDLAAPGMERDAEANAMKFQFKSITFRGFDKEWSKDLNSKPKTYTFFYANEKFALARSSGRGVALLVKEE